ALIGRLSIPDRIAQIECAAGDDTAAIVLRHLDPLTSGDEKALIEWSQHSGIAVWLQPAGPDSVTRLWPEQHQLSYRLDAFGLELTFDPWQFVQINAEVNRKLTQVAVELMGAGPDDRVLDLFCGLGNFSLPLASRAGEVLGIELDESLVASGSANAAANGVANAHFMAADLMQSVDELEWMRRPFDGVLIDPPRCGAAEILPLVAASGARSVVYVSCDPATLARDAGMLVNEYGYRLEMAGIADMFPHTAHVESLALFRKD
ncbi:MAG: methyltransferase domain-containing protein, partial [Wenzhouxiangellaceae bacterium]